MSDAAVQWFWSDETGAFHDTASDHERLITRPREIADNATPSGTSLAVELLLHLADLTNDTEMRRRATFVLQASAGALIKYPTAFGHLLGAADMAVHGAVEVAIAGGRSDARFGALEREVAAHYVPSLVLAGGDPEARGPVALLADRVARDGVPTAYVCRSYTCDTPVTDADALAGQLENAGRAITQPVDTQ